MIEQLLNEISLRSFITIENSFTGAYMQEHLRVWVVRIDLRFIPREQFAIRGSSLLQCLTEAKRRIDDYYLEHGDK